MRRELRGRGYRILVFRFRGRYAVLYVRRVFHRFLSLYERHRHRQSKRFRRRALFPFVRRLSRMSFALRTFVDSGFQSLRQKDSERCRSGSRRNRARRFDRSRSVRNV